MKYLKILVIVLVISIFFASSGASAYWRDILASSIEVPGFRGTVKLNMPVTALGHHYVKTNTTVDKLNSKQRATEVKVYAVSTSDTSGSSWLYLPNGGDYQDVGDLGFGVYDLKVREKTSSILGFYWFGQWKFDQQS